MSGPRSSIVAALLHQRPDLMSDDPYEGFLKAKEAALLAELASVRATLADRARLTGGANPEDKAKAKRLSREKANPYSGLTVSDAIVEVLEESAVPLSAGQIWTVLQRAGVEPISEDSVKAITWSLRKRARNHKDVVRVAHGKWDLRVRYSDAQLRKLAKSNTGMGSLTRDDHVARTKAGMEKRRAAGLKLGQPSLMTPERTAEVEDDPGRRKHSGDRATCSGVGRYNSKPLHARRHCETAGRRCRCPRARGCRTRALR